MTAPGKLIYGFNPYWMGDAYEGYNFGMLSRVAYYAYSVNPHTGRYQSVHQWKQTGLVAKAHRQGCKVDLCITNHGRHANTVFLSRPAAQRRLMDSVLLAARHADGVNLDFQEIPVHRKAHFTRFVKQFAALLARSNPNYVLTITLPPVDWDEVFDVKGLAPSVGYFIVSGYDYYGADSPAPGPGSLLYSSGRFNSPNIDFSVKQYLARGVKPNQFILCLPYMGYLWQQQSPEFVPQPYFALRGEAYRRGAVDTTVWATRIGRTDGAADGWFDNAASLAGKYDYINRNGLAGVGIWALGYDRGFDDLWALLARKFLLPKPPPVPVPKRVVRRKLPIPLSSPTDYTLLSQAVVPEAAGAPEGPAYVPRKLPVANHTPQVMAWIAFGAVLLGAAALVGFLVSLVNPGVRAAVLGRPTYQLLLAVLLLLLTGAALYLWEITVAPVYLVGAGLLLTAGVTAGVLLSRKPGRSGRLR